ncbi:unnamed protein product [Moneuplotes crassus]|uniref:Uncharacterized protein n=1 Tax=Euplotes crassus TaxID=5936 RepID=A0AAD1Y383_EUPCR|nr:unnamed protein product [Moneuplotes crassus]
MKELKNSSSPKGPKRGLKKPPKEPKKPKNPLLLSSPLKPWSTCVANQALLLLAKSDWIRRKYKDASRSFMNQRGDNHLDRQKVTKLLSMNPDSFWDCLVTASLDNSPLVEDKDGKLFLTDPDENLNEQEKVEKMTDIILEMLISDTRSKISDKISSLKKLSNHLLLKFNLFCIYHTSILTPDQENSNPSLDYLKKTMQECFNKVSLLKLLFSTTYIPVTPFPKVLSAQQKRQPKNLTQANPQKTQNKSLLKKRERKEKEIGDERGRGDRVEEAVMLILKQIGFDELIKEEVSGSEESREEKKNLGDISGDIQHAFVKRNNKYRWEDGYLENEKNNYNLNGYIL